MILDSRNILASRGQRQAPTYNDLMVKVSCHSSPFSFQQNYDSPPVRTGLMTSSDSPIVRASAALIMPLSHLFSTSLEETGNYMLHGLLNASKGAFRVGCRGEDLGLDKYVGSEEARKILWEHTVKAT
jgi:hypothetical protein